MFNFVAVKKVELSSLGKESYGKAELKFCVALKGSISDTGFSFIFMLT